MVWWLKSHTAIAVTARLSGLPRTELVPEKHAAVQTLRVSHHQYSRREGDSLLRLVSTLLCSVSVLRCDYLNQHPNQYIQVLVWGCKTLEQRFIIYHSGLNRLSPFLRSGQKTPTPCFVVQHLYSLSSPDHCPYDNLFATGETVDYYKNDACKLYKAHNYEDWRECCFTRVRQRFAKQAVQVLLLPDSAK